MRSLRAIADIAVFVIVAAAVLGFTVRMIGGHVVLTFAADAVIVAGFAWALQRRVRSVRRKRRDTGRP